MELLPPIRSLDKAFLEIGGAFRRLDKSEISQVFDVMHSAVQPGVAPPGFAVSIEDAEQLFKPPSSQELVPITGVFGCFLESHKLGGFVAFSELDVDGETFLEFYIFFRKEARQPGLALDGASRLIKLAKTHVSNPICTLIYAENSIGKRFYTRAGFSFFRRVSIDEMKMELWTYSENASIAEICSSTEKGTDLHGS